MVAGGDERGPMTTRRVGLAALVVALVVGAVVVTLLLTRSSKENIYLESAASLGPNPFTTGGVVQDTTTTEATVAGTTTTEAQAVGTTTTALYGGSGNLLRCDPEALIAFLMTHADKAGAWIEPFNGDPTFRWGEDHMKTTLTVADIPAYIHELTPTHLLRDTRVTNTGYKNGHATFHQSLLERGMAVLVDWQGVPRVKCRCGNRLWRPHAVKNLHYVGVCWPGCHNPPCVGTGCAETTTTTGPKETTTTICIDTATVNCDTTTTRRTTTTRHITTTTPATSTTKPPPTTTPATTVVQTTTRTTQKPAGVP
jgi:uncharacterized protein DUF6777